MLVGDITVVNFALTLWGQEGGIGKDDSADELAQLTSHHGRCHTSH